MQQSIVNTYEFPFFIHIKSVDTQLFFGASSFLPDPISEYSRGIEDENMLIILNKDKILTNSNFFDLPDKAAIAGFKLYETPFMRNAVFQKRIFNRTFRYINNADLH